MASVRRTYTYGDKRQAKTPVRLIKPIIDHDGALLLTLKIGNAKVFYAEVAVTTEDFTEHLHAMLAAGKQFAVTLATLKAKKKEEAADDGIPF